MKRILLILFVLAVLTISGCQEYNDVTNCGNCVEYTAPGPDFCPNGNIVGGGLDECGCGLPPECEQEYTIATVLDDECSQDTDCETPMDYLVRSSCPFESKCIDGNCAVICPKVWGCAEDARVCDDGTTVVRDPANNCQFPECQEMMEGELKETYCQPEQRGDVPCTREYMPVCGWSGPEIQCLAYPCASTYGNKCTACADENVAYWTEGECPTSIPSDKTMCKPEQRGAEMCTMEYRPVCGSDGETYSNPCGACIPEEVEYWTEGECTV